ncbi:hypothetical protein LCGC14_0998550 [marine sediment metagenome]|uniref:Uncharacterized protein n=1 Tax=marine sediment metagenome TaxID=412755 RepID=A0A0F9N8G0_9ZZZZ
MSAVRRGLLLLTMVVLSACVETTGPVSVVENDRNGLEVSVVQIGDGMGSDTLSFMAAYFESGSVRMMDVSIKLEDLLGFVVEGSDDDGTISVTVSFDTANIPTLHFTAWTSTASASLVWPNR